VDKKGKLDVAHGKSTSVAKLARGEKTRTRRGLRLLDRTTRAGLIDPARAVLDIVGYGIAGGRPEGMAMRRQSCRAKFERTSRLSSRGRNDS